MCHCVPVQVRNVTLFTKDNRIFDVTMNGIRQLVSNLPQPSGLHFKNVGLYSRGQLHEVAKTLVAGAPALSTLTIANCRGVDVVSDVRVMQILGGLSALTHLDISYSFGGLWSTTHLIQCIQVLGNFSAPLTQE